MHADSVIILQYYCVIFYIVATGVKYITREMQTGRLKNLTTGLEQVGRHNSSTTKREQAGGLESNWEQT